MASGSGWNLWVWLVGVVVGRYIYIDFLMLLILTPLVSVLFLFIFFLSVIYVVIFILTTLFC